MIRSMMVALALSPFLAACGGGGGGGAGGSTSAAGIVSAYEPVYATEPLPGDLNPFDQMSESLYGGPGASGIMAVTTFFDPTPRFAWVKVRSNADGSKLYLIFNGGAEIELDEGAGGSYGPNPPFSAPLVGFTELGNAGWINYTLIEDSGLIPTPIDGSGVIGIETPIANLPSGAGVVYNGDVTLFSFVDSMTRDDIGAVNSAFEMTVDFDGGTITGTTGGGFLDNMSVANGTINDSDDVITGTVTGSTSNGSLIGTMTFNSSVGSASVEFAGKTYGWSAQEVGGAAIGEMTGTAVGTLPIAGWFLSDP